MKILILGSQGFIGRNISRNFKDWGYSIVGVDIVDNMQPDIYDYIKISRISPEWSHIFSKHIFDFCINAAGSGDVNYSMSHPLMDFESNTLETIRILDAIRLQNPACKYLHISSAAVYGNPDSLPVREDSLTHPLSPYGWHKLMAEQICREYADLYNIQTIIVRPFSVYGPGLRKQLFWDVYRKIQSGREEIELWGTGNESRDFIYIDDLAKALHLVISHSSGTFEIINVASGLEIPIHKAIRIFIACLQEKTTVIFNNQTREGDPVNWLAEIGKLKNLGFQPEISITQGLENVGNWFRSLTP